MGVSEIGSPQKTRERSPEWSRPEFLPEPTVEATWLEASDALRVEADREFRAVDHGEAGARTG
jgi:hypothetical protein